MKSSRMCKETHQEVMAIIENINITDGNGIYVAGSREKVKDCSEKNCKNYRACKIYNFKNLER